MSYAYGMKQVSTVSGGVRIRLAKRRDLPSIVQLRREFDRYHELPGLWPPEGGRRENFARYRRMLRQSTARLFVAECSSHGMVGYLTALIQARKCADREFRRVGVIGEAFVKRSHRGRGTGNALVMAAAQFLQSRRIKHLSVRNAIGNRSANEFWEKLSFKPVLYTRTTWLDRLTRVLSRRRAWS